ncbi:MAG: phosphoribosyltransferase [Nanoarchaeota archaeon]|nr:phosphoribosyltransferase [Nanoarchaeota archaeon]MBU4086439.1 phosphoribosyltransferase [Nanoarchaeota archaeon]
MSKFPELRKSIDSARVIELPQSGSKTYKFKTFAFGERGTKITAELLKEIVEGLCGSVKQNFPNFDYVVSPEPGGHTWGSLVALKLGKPINLLRTNPSYEDGELEVPRKTGYYQHNLYFNHFKKGDRVLIVDDVVSTGGTLKTILSKLKSQGIMVMGVQVIFAKSEDYQKIEKEFSVKVKFLEKSRNQD